jgi:hypothetical protein
MRKTGVVCGFWTVEEEGRHQVMELPTFPHEGLESFGIGSERELDTVVSGLQILERDPTQDHSYPTELLSASVSKFIR